MPDSQATAGFGVQLQRGNSATPETFTAVAEMTKLKPPKWKLNTADVTNHSSPGGWIEVIGTLKDGGSFSCELNYLPTDPTHNGSVGLLGDLANATKRTFKIVFPASAGSVTWTFKALVTEFEASPELDKQLMATVTFTVSGQPTLA